MSNFYILVDYLKRATAAGLEVTTSVTMTEVSPLMWFGFSAPPVIASPNPCLALD